MAGILETIICLQAKINQFPGMYMIGRKDCLAKCYQEMGKKFGKEQFDFHPRTFLLPDDQDQLTKFMEDNKKQMIMKPPNWFNGMGIKMIKNIGKYSNYEKQYFKFFSSEEIPSKHGRAIVQVKLYCLSFYQQSSIPGVY